MSRRDVRAGSARTRRLGLGAAVFLLALIVRLLPLGLYVTPDEPIWVQRSVQFLDAARAGEWSGIPQTGHPGITTMVLGAFGTWITTRLAPATAAEHLNWIRAILWLAPENEAAFEHLAFFLPAGRVLVALTVSLALSLAYFIARPRLGARPARLVVLFLALDPFFAAYAGLLHTDALQATFAFLAVLLALPIIPPYLDAASRTGAEWLSWIGSGLFLALAGLTKTLGLLVAPGLALAVLLGGDAPLRRRALKVTVIAVAAFVCLFALYPPFWSDPTAAVRSLLDAVTYHEGIGLRSVFFMGQSHVDPGPAFYPVVLLFRFTPPVLVGLLLWGAEIRRHRARVEPGLALLLPAFLYLITITFASKKFDRYALTVVPLVTGAAALAWHRFRGWRWAAALGLVLPWAWTALVPLQYASPLLGGTWAAQHVVPLGWGEGTGFAVHRLNRQLADPDAARVMSRNVPGAASLFQGEVWPWDGARQGCADAVLGTEGIDPEIFTIREDIQVAGLPQATILYQAVPGATETRMLTPGPLPGIAPAATAPVANAAQLAAWLGAYLANGEPFVWIHASSCYPLTESQLVLLLDTYRASGELSCEPIQPVRGFPAERCVLASHFESQSAFLGRFAGRVDLVAVTPNAVARAPEPLTVHLRWQPQVSLGDLELYLALVTEVAGEQIIWAEGGRHVVDGAGRSTSAWQPGGIFDSEGYVLLPLDLPPGTYQLVMQVSEAGGWMGLAYSDGTFGGVQMPLGSIRVEPPPYPAPALDLSAASEVAWAGLRVVGVREPAEEVWAGNPVHFGLGVERTTGPTPPSLVWELECDGTRLDGGALDWPLSPPVEWPGGHRYVLRFAPRLDPSLPEGMCRVLVAPLVSAPEERSVTLGTIRVLQRERAFELPQVPQVEVEATGRFAHLRGVDLSASSIAPGERVSVTLYWEAVETAANDYTIFVHLVGPDGQVWGQSDAAPAEGRAPTTTWLPGEVVVDAHTLVLRPEAPEGDYQLYVGLYDAQTGTRVSFHDDPQRPLEERVRVTELQVIR